VRRIGRTARGIDQTGRRFHQGQFFGSDQAPRSLAQDEVDAQEIGLLEQCFLRHELCAGRNSALRGEVLAPGDYIHSECQADPGDLSTDIAKP
jgi:hypothetical protein